MTKKAIKILAIDDHIDNLVVLKALLNDSFPDALFISADSGMKGIELCQAEIPDVILLDIVMPGMDGYEVCKRFKADIRLKHIPVIMITANRTDKESRVRALESGADAFLPKPVDISELKAQIKAMLRIKEAEDLKKAEKQKLEDMVLDRTEALELELTDRKKAEKKLILSLEKITRNRQAIMNLMEDLKSEIGERTLIEKNLQYERNLLRTLIDNLPDTIYFFDKECRKIIANKADVEVIGCEKEEDVLGKTDLDMYPGESGKRFYTESMNVIKTGIPKIDYEEKFIDKTGKVRFLNTSQIPLYDAGGQIKGLVGIGHDITKRKLAEQELEIKNNELSFLNTIGFELTKLTSSDNINEFIARRLKDFSGAELAVSFDYIPEKAVIKIKHVETSMSFLNKITKELGRKFFETEIPVSPESLEYILNEYFAKSTSLSEISFGQVPEFADKIIKKVTGIDHYCVIANVTGGEYFGTTLLGFREGIMAPRKEVLLSFARLVAIAIQKRRYEDKLKESEEKYRLLIENQGEGVGVVDLEERFSFANPSADEMFGVERGGLMNRSLMDFLDPEQQTIIKKESKKRSKSEKSTYEIDIIRPKGEKRTILITATPQFSKEGELTGTFGVFRDITERKKMEQKIIESETYYRTLIDISPDGIIISDLEGNITYGSIKALEIFEVPHGTKVTGTSIFNWLSTDEQEAIMERVMEIMKGNIAPETREYRLRRFDGSIFWGELSSSPLSDPDGSPSALIIVCRDISDRKKAEMELIRSKDKAEESDRLKTAFLHNISHEIRTPMNAIVGFSTLLGEEDINAETRKSYTDVIMQSSNHLLAIITDIVEISNIEANLVITSRNEISINSKLKSLCDQFRPKTEAKNVKLLLENDLADADSLIFTDSTKLVQILSNLISNAVKFTEYGEIKIVYKVKGSFLEFCISDTGIGIPEEFHTRIFDRFYQVHGNVSRLYEGTGLGLAISKAYVELMGGKIWLHSVPGNGTTFYFTIPYEPKLPLAAEEVVKDLSDRFIFPAHKTILVAEDIDSNFKLISYFLSKANVTVIRANNGREAVDIALTGKNIDLILMDIKMPVMDGYTATVLIREHNQVVPIIAQTAYLEDKEKAIETGCSGFLSKPFDRKSLFKILNEFL